MPTTEIISIGAMEGPFTTRLKHVKHRCDSELNSDRDLFQDRLDHLVGTIVHIGAISDIEDDHFYFLGGDYYVENNVDEDHWAYKEEVFGDIIILIRSMQEQSPVNHVVFLTDFQGGPEEDKTINLPSIEDFITLNNSKELRFNTLYSIGGILEERKYWDFCE